MVSLTVAPAVRRLNVNGHTTAYGIGHHRARWVNQSPNRTQLPATNANRRIDIGTPDDRVAAVSTASGRSHPLGGWPAGLLPWATRRSPKRVVAAGQGASTACLTPSGRHLGADMPNKWRRSASPLNISRRRPPRQPQRDRCGVNISSAHGHPRDIGDQLIQPDAEDVSNSHQLVDPNT